MGGMCGFTKTTAAGYGLQKSKTERETLSLCDSYSVTETELDAIITSPVTCKGSHQDRETERKKERKNKKEGVISWIISDKKTN